MSNYDPTDIRSQERAQAESDTQKKLAKDTEKGDMKWLLATKRGRRIVWRLLDQAGVFNPTFNTNAMTMAFAEGNRNSGNRLLTQIMSVAPDAFLMMMKEQSNDSRNDDDGSHNDH